MSFYSFILGIVLVVMVMVILNAAAVLSVSFRPGYESVFCNFDGLEQPGS